MCKTALPVLALDQAKVWSSAIQAGEADLSAVSESFVRELQKLGATEVRQRLQEEQQQQRHHDQVNDRNGAFAAERRVQPRLQSDDGAAFDAMAQVRERAERERAAASKARAERLRNVLAGNALDVNEGMAEVRRMADERKRILGRDQSGRRRRGSGAGD